MLAGPAVRLRADVNEDRPALLDALRAVIGAIMDPVSCVSCVFSAESMALIDAPRPTEEVPPGLLVAS
jgi:hypothetical protein